MLVIKENVLTISGDADLRTISEVHKELSAFIHDQKFDVLNLDEIAEVDLTLIQLIESARISATKEGKGISLSSPASGALLAALERGGFLGDATDPRTQFWLAA